MIGQEGRKPVGSFIKMVGIAILGLTFMFLSTIVFQTSATSLQKYKTGDMSFVSSSGDRNGNGGFPAGSNSVLRYPLISDKYLGYDPLAPGLFAEASKKWKAYTGDAPKYPLSQFSGSDSVNLKDLNWMSIDDKNYSTTFSMTFDPISVDSFSSRSFGNVNVQLFDNGVPVIFNLPFVSASMGQNFAFAIQGKSTLDYLVFEQTAFDAISFTSEDNLQEYYDYISTHTLKNGTLILNNTFTYNETTTLGLDKAKLEKEFANIEQGEVKYSMISIQNQTLSTSNFQSYALTKRSARRRDKTLTANATIDLLEYDYNMKIVRYAKSHIDNKYKILYIPKSNMGNNADGNTNSLTYPAPATPIFQTNNDDWLNVATLSQNPNLISIFRYETYIDAVPIIILNVLYFALTVAFTVFALVYNHDRYKDKMYSITQETLNYLLYNPSTVLFPIIEKVCGIGGSNLEEKGEKGSENRGNDDGVRQFSMVDGYDPKTGCNHLGLVRKPFDSDSITAREPDVPYGLAPRPKRSKTVTRKEVV